MYNVLPRISPVFALAMALGASTVSAHTNQASCLMAKQDNGYSGVCNIPHQVQNLAVNFDGLKPTYRIGFHEDRIVTTSLSKNGDNWIGKMVGRKPEDPRLFELISNNNGEPTVGKLPYGWFHIDEFQEQNGSLLVKFNVEHQVAPTEVDIRILSRASEILSSNKVWNKEDTRICPDNATKYSVFCALIKATYELTGKKHYRQPAMQAAREVVNVVSAGKYKKHRIQEWNNDPATSLKDVYSLLEQAQKQTKARIIDN